MRMLFSTSGKASSRRMMKALAFAAVSLACTGDSIEEAVYLDLVERFSTVVERNKTLELDLGTPAARPFLAGGWSRDRFDTERGLPFATSTRRRSSIRFELFQPRALQATLRGLLGDARHARRIAVSVSVNGEAIGSFPLTPRLRKHRLTIPAAATRAGLNHLTLEPALTSQAGLPRAAWYSLTLGTPHRKRQASAAPRALTQERALFLPAGTELAYPVLLQPRSSLRAQRLRLRGEGAALDIWLETDGGDREPVAAVTASRASLSVLVPGDEPRAALLVLRASSDTRAKDGGGVLIEVPELWAPRVAPRRETERPAAVASSPRPNVLLYLVDTLRRDRLGCYGNDRGLSPNIDAFAARATLFENSIGQSTWTRASVASIFTGVWPPVHGAIGWRNRLSPELATLPATLQAAGYRTAAFVTNVNVRRDAGFHRGFDEFDQIGKPDSKRLNALVGAWLDRHDLERPFFVLVHTMDPHAPYRPPEPYRTRFALDTASVTSAPDRRWAPEQAAALSSLYDAEIAYNDEHFGALVADLERRGLYDDTLILFLSDHGEEFLEHGWWRHGAGLHAESLDVPLIVKLAGQTAGRRISEPVQHIDVLPTVLDSVGLPIPDAVEGVSLARPEMLTAERPVYSHLRLGSRPAYASLVTGDWKLIRTDDRGRISHELYNWRDDPGEGRDLSSELPIRTAVLAAMLQSRWDQVRPSEPAEDLVLDEEFKAELKALGYLQ